MDDQPDDLSRLIESTRHYYAMLRESGIPEELAVRIVGDWYNAAVTLAVSYFHNQFTKSVERLNRRMVRSMGDDE